MKKKYALTGLVILFCTLLLGATSVQAKTIKTELYCPESEMGVSGDPEKAWFPDGGCISEEFLMRGSSQVTLLVTYISWRITT